MKVKRARSSYVLVVGILALLVAGSFLGYSLYSAVVKSQISARQETAIRPLVGSLNTEAIKNMELRRQFSSSELSNVESLDYSDEKDKVKSEQPSSIVKVEKVK